MIARCVWNYSNETQEEWSHIDALLLRTSRRTEGNVIQQLSTPSQTTEYSFCSEDCFPSVGHTEGRF